MSPLKFIHSATSNSSHRDSSFIATHTFEMDGRVASFFILLLCSSLIIDARDADLIRRKRIVGGIAAAQPPKDDPVVFVNKNDRHARIIGNRDPDKGFYTFRGIRFGEPPIGRARFQVLYISMENTMPLPADLLVLNPAMMEPTKS